jgi:hypothetical protein
LLVAAVIGLAACGDSRSDRTDFKKLLPERRQQAAALKRSDLAGNARLLRLVPLPAGTRALESRVTAQVGYYRAPPWQGRLTPDEENDFGLYVRAALPGEADEVLSTGWATTLELEAPETATAEEMWDFYVQRLVRPWISTRRDRESGGPNELHFYRARRCLVVTLGATSLNQVQGRFDVSVFPTDPANAPYC